MNFSMKAGKIEGIMGDKKYEHYFKFNSDEWMIGKNLAHWICPLDMYTNTDFTNI